VRPVTTYTLKPIDLTRHVATRSGVIRYHLPIGTPLGKHLPVSAGSVAKEFDVKGVTFEDHVKQLDSLMQRVQNNDDSEAVDENAWMEVTSRLDAMTKIAREKEAELRLERKGYDRPVKPTRSRTMLRLKQHAPKRAMEIGKEWAHESAAHSLAIYGVNFAASAVSLIGAQQSEKFVEAFHHIIENPSIEIGVTTGLALLISALITRIRKALKERHDRKIEAKRGELFQ
jgi:hypothetical protein